MGIVEIDFSKLNLSLQPHIMAAILQLKDDSDTNFTELERLIKSDQNLTGFILKAANSPLYSRGTEVRKLQHAISLLGFRVIRSLASAAGSKQLFESANYARFRKYVWQHSVVSAVIAMKVIGEAGLKDLKEEVFVAALLHDLGKVVLNAMDRKMYIDVLNQIEGGGISFKDAEKKVFGIDHMEAGELAAKEWKLPSIYGTVLGNHDRLRDGFVSSLPEKDRALLLGSAAGNILARRCGYGLQDGESDGDLDFALTGLGLSGPRREALLATVGDQIENDEFYKFFITMV